MCICNFCIPCVFVFLYCTNISTIKRWMLYISKIGQNIKDQKEKEKNKKMVQETPVFDNFWLYRRGVKRKKFFKKCMHLNPIFTPCFGKSTLYSEKYIFSIYKLYAWFIADLHISSSISTRWTKFLPIIHLQFSRLSPILRYITDCTRLYQYLQTKNI